MKPGQESALNHDFAKVGDVRLHYGRSCRVGCRAEASGGSIKIGGDAGAPAGSLAG
jgi:hypothetical protein